MEAWMWVIVGLVGTFAVTLAISWVVWAIADKRKRQRLQEASEAVHELTVSELETREGEIEYEAY